MLLFFFSVFMMEEPTAMIVRSRRVDRNETKTGTKIAEKIDRERAKSDVRRSRAYYDQSQTPWFQTLGPHTCLNTRIVEARSSVLFLFTWRFC